MKLPAITFRTVLTIVAAVALGAELTACGSGSSGGTPPAPSAPTAATADQASSSPATPKLSPRELQFASDARNTFSFGGNIQDAALAYSGLRICHGRKAGASVAAEAPSAMRTWASLSKGDAVQMIMLAEKDICPSQSTPQQVTYVVTGSGAHVTYGAAGANYAGSAPLSVTQPLGQPQYYSINAQLTGNGSVTCSLKVDGVIISSASATGSGNIASCEIDQDLNGSWEATSVTG
jgi:hypothetical protein